MTKEQFLQLVTHAADTTALHVDSIEQVVNTFPYMQSAAVLLAKMSVDNGSMFSHLKVKKAALYAPDRAKLRANIVAANIHVISDSALAEEKKNTDAAVEHTLAASPLKEIPPSGIINETLDKEGVQLLRDEIQQVLLNLKQLEKEFLDKNQELTPKKNPLLSLLSDTENAAEIKPSSMPMPPSEAGTYFSETEAKAVPTLKFYIHSEDFGHTPKAAKKDLLSEFMEYRGSNLLTKPDINQQKQIIEKFLESTPVINVLNSAIDTQSKKDLSTSSTRLNEEIISETLANILVNQKKYDKAIDMFEKLKLKYPEKSAYFAQKIANIQSGT